MPDYNIRATTADILLNVLEKGKSLTTALDVLHTLKERDRGLVQEIAYGVMRTLPELEFYVQTLMTRVFTKETRILHYLLLVGLYQLCYTRIPAHAALSETVEATVIFKKKGFKSVINGVLRQFLRQKESLKTDFLALHDRATLHPAWLLKKLKTAYPTQWQTITDENNQRPPLWIRLNQRHPQYPHYLSLLDDMGIEYAVDSKLPCAVHILTPLPVQQLPFFAEGAVTVQDRSAQYAAFLVDPKPHQSILDLCAAPGGKTTHLLEREPTIHLLAVDNDPQRVRRIKENLTRLQLDAEVIVGDGLTPKVWAEEAQFDAILLDAPCSATGVIRRHPDIKWLRQASDIETLTHVQSKMLRAIWPYLKSGGRLVYATCSILPEENHQQVEHFLAQHNDAELVGEMQQLLPTAQGGDGFFYAQLIKK